jgi:glutaminyl-peptide cyclotransferase
VKSSKPPASTRKFSGQKLFLAAALLISCLALGYMALTTARDGGRAAGPVSTLRLEDIPFDGARAYEYLKQLCAVGPRRSGSPGMAAQQALLADHFQKLGGQIEWQRFSTRHPLDGSEVPLANLVVHWHPDRKERVLLCVHYDTLPFPLRDPDNPRGRFIGANDGGSGIAVLMELAQQMCKLDVRYGVDFVFFDAEEFIFQEDGRFFLGSEHFAGEYVRNPPPYRYRAGVLLDMVGSADLRLYQEKNSMSWRDTRPLVEEIWATAARLGVREFVPAPKYEIRDDHLALHDIAKIPTCDLIDFDYPPWHTQGDTADKCSALSLAKVGWVLTEWLKRE